MLTIVLAVSTAFLIWLLLNVHVTDPMWLQLNRAWYVWIAAGGVIISATLLTIEAFETWNSIRYWQDLGEKIGAQKEKPVSFFQVLERTVFGFNFFCDPIVPIHTRSF